jgi:PDZ domain-containing secreted protein
MLALSVIAQLAPDDPTARPDGAASGRPPLVVAGTGALEPDGRVLGVGGLEHKLRSVIADARGGTLPDAFLLPAEDLAIARRVPLARDLLLVPVSDLAGAVDALAVLARGARPEGAVLVAATDRGGR